MPNPQHIDWMSDLVKIYLTDQEITNWLIAKHPQLEGRSPLDMIRVNKESEVAKIVDQLASGAHI